VSADAAFEASRPLRVLVVDADHRVRESLASLLGLSDEVEVVGSVGHVVAALDQCADTQPDAIVLDPRLPDIDAGLALIGTLRRRFPGVRVVVLGWGDTIEQDAIAIGADAYLGTATSPTELVERIAALGRAGPSARPILG
jgi:DNA-binding NarL/FixJ family response regulator